MNNKDKLRLVGALMQHAVEQGTLIACGYRLYELCMQPHVPPEQVAKDAFYAGADHVLTCLLTALSRNPDNDVLKPTLREITEHRKAVELRLSEAKGNA